MLSKTHCTVTLYFDHASRLSFIKRYKKLEISGMICGKKQWIKTCALPSSLNLFIEFSLYKKVNTKMICLILRILGMSGLSFTTQKLHYMENSKIRNNSFDCWWQVQFPSITYIRWLDRKFVFQIRYTEYSKVPIDC